MRKILIVNLTRFGDLLQTSATIAGLKELHPQAELTVLVERNFAEVCHGLPGIDRVREIDLDQLGRLIISGTGQRVAESYNGLPTAAPLLHIEAGPSDPAPDIDAVPNPYGFGPVVVNTTASGSIEIRNVGTQDLAVTASGLAGADAAQMDPRHRGDRRERNQRLLRDRQRHVRQRHDQERRRIGCRGDEAADVEREHHGARRHRAGEAGDE